MVNGILSGPGSNHIIHYIASQGTNNISNQVETLNRQVFHAAKAIEPLKFSAETGADFSPGRRRMRT